MRQSLLTKATARTTTARKLTSDLNVEEHACHAALDKAPMRAFLEPSVCVLTVLSSSAPPEFIPDWAKSST